MLRALLSALLLCAALVGQGVQLKADAQVLYGAAAKCSQPASVDFCRLKKLTPEWKLIKSEGVDRGSARYDLLMEDLNKRIKRLVADAAKTAGKDCVLRKGDIENANGLTVVDLTEQIDRKSVV